MNNMIKQFTSVMVLAFAISATADAQEKKHVTLEEAITTAAVNNANIQMAELDRKVSNANYHQTDAIFLPQVSVGYNAMTTNNPLNAFGFLLQQKGVTMQDMDPAKLNHPSAAQNYGASVDVQLPLLNLDMIFARQGAKHQENVYKYKAQYTKEYIKFEVQKAYTQLQFDYQAQSVLKATLTDVEQIYQSVKNFYDQGLVQQSDVLNAQVQVNTIESALSKAESNIANASDGLKLLMGVGEEYGHILIPDTLTRKDSFIETPTLSLMRSDVMAMRSALEATNAMVKSSAMNFLPRIIAFGSYQFNDSQIFKFKNDSYLAGISLSWTVFSGNQNRSKYKSASYQRDKMQMELDHYIDKSKLEVSKTTRDLIDLQKEIDKQQASVAHASEALRILSNRFKEGLVSTTDLLMSQAQLSQHRLTLVQAVMNYNITTYYQDLLTTIN